LTLILIVWLKKKRFDGNMKNLMEQEMFAVCEKIISGALFAALQV
jgi:hypothetical protein